MVILWKDEREKALGFSIHKFRIISTMNEGNLLALLSNRVNSLN